MNATRFGTEPASHHAVLAQPHCRAAERTTVPLRTWNGFALHWHWTCDAIKKLGLAGLTDRVVLNTKPMSRLEMARIVIQAITKIVADDG